ncbi:T9SS type A sorting domain-containing protein [Hugenholtzia roseola]|uniref:T9SS type A sorting domain-containing protein n=1 Tax=Hugenholtzia roseola TaxID=1002 RepID=UPI000408DF21|nr:T9SS type A sorting domain-containing protein [Hugenholtzia roseola]
MKKNILFLSMIGFFLLWNNTTLLAQSDACADATAITANFSCNNSNYSIPSTFTRDAISAASCVSNANNREDGWHSFTAIGTSSTITITTNRDVAIAVYSGSCGSLTELGCEDALGNNGTETLTIATTVGTTYFIRIIRYEAGGNNNMTGNICVTSPPPPPVNDICTGAIELTVGEFECSPINGTTVNATASNAFGGAPSCASGNGAEDVWYRFTAPASGDIALSTIAGTMTDSGMQLYHAPDGTCGSLNSVECDDDDGQGSMSQIVNYNLIPGDVYYVRIWDFGGGQSTFGVCVQQQYSDCNVSIPLCSDAAFNTNSFGFGATQDPINNCFGTFSESQSVWINFEAQTTGTLSFVIDSQNSPADDYDFIVYRANNPDFCTNVATNGTVVSCNARSSVGAGGTTGVSTALGGTTNSEGPNAGNPFNLDINATAGDRFYLLINNFSTTGIGFNLSFGGTADLDCTILPVEMQEFKGQVQGERNLLQWVTVSEWQSEAFEVERSADGKNFVYLGRIQAGKNGKSKQYYQFADNQPLEGDNYYRLKQIDQNQTFTYSKTILLRNAFKKSFQITNLYPNPAQEELSLTFYLPQNDLLYLEFLTAEGKKCFSDTRHFEAGEQTWQHNIASLPAGLYLIRLTQTQKGETSFKKFIKR